MVFDTFKASKTELDLTPSWNHSICSLLEEVGLSCDQFRDIYPSLMMKLPASRHFCSLWDFIQAWKTASVLIWDQTNQECERANGRRLKNNNRPNRPSSQNKQLPISRIKLDLFTELEECVSNIIPVCLVHLELKLPQVVVRPENKPWKSVTFHLVQVIPGSPHNIMLVGVCVFDWGPGRQYA